MSVPEWPSETVEDCLERVSVPSALKLQTKDYRPSGIYPIVDQGQELIAGWTDEDAGVVSAPLPLIVFGDHTRAFKFINFPFVRGADGTQLLKPRSGIDPLYFFYACRAIDLPSRGYNRHFSILKEKIISLPPPDEQNGIAIILRQVERYIDLQQQQLSSAEQLKRAAMRELFTCGLRGEAQKETEIGLVPDSWDTPTIESAAYILSTRASYGELLQRPATNDDPTALKVLGIKVADMARVGAEVAIEEAELERYLPAAEAEQRCAPPGVIVFPKNGAAVAKNKKRLVGHWSAFDPNVMGLSARDGVLQAYLFHWMQGFDLASIVKPGPVPHFNKSDIARVRISVPTTLNEQREIIAILDAIDRKIDLHKRKRAVVDVLFKTMLHKLMTGEIRVVDLDVSALDDGATAGVAA
jgi:type I restriction enzyme, S subunit